MAGYCVSAMSLERRRPVWLPRHRPLDHHLMNHPMEDSGAVTDSATNLHHNAAAERAKAIREMTSAERADERDRDPDGYFQRLSAENTVAAIADVRARDRRRARDTRRRWLRRLSFGLIGGDR